jgi:hypothetical protein
MTGLGFKWMWKRDVLVHRSELRLLLYARLFILGTISSLLLAVSH